MVVLNDIDGKTDSEFTAKFLKEILGDVK